MAMRPYLTLFSGIFLVMALSNAIVPVLPAYTTDNSLNGLIYAGYFLGAFLITLPAGVLSDTYGRIPFIRLGLAITVTSGLFLAITTTPAVIIAARLVEGLGAGLFVAAAMSAVNSDPDHVRLSGWLMASMNAGLVTGLVAAGWLAAFLRVPPAGIVFFALLSAVPATASFLVREPARHEGVRDSGRVKSVFGQYRWLWYSSVVLIGITGVVTSLYPQLSGAPSDLLGIWIAGMSIATIASVLIFSRTRMQPVPAIRTAALLMAGGVIISFFSPAGFLVLGALAGIVLIGQMAFLAGVPGHQGTVMGFFSTFSYLGMAVMPAATGFVAQGLGFPAAFTVTAIAALSVAATIGRCTCSLPEGNRQNRSVQENEQ
jgi:MFS family permease